MANEDLADVAVVRVLLEQARVADLLGGLLADEEVAIAANDLEQGLVGLFPGHGGLHLIQQIVVVQGEPALDSWHGTLVPRSALPGSVSLVHHLRCSRGSLLPAAITVSRLAADRDP